MTVTAAARLAALGAALVLSACGGGGSGGLALPLAAAPATGAATTSAALPASSSLAAQCAAPRSGIDPDTGRAYPDRSGTLENEKAWVRSWIDETYLWYDEVPANLSAADYATPVTYFAVLKTGASTASGRPKDRFHFTANSADYAAQVDGAALPGYGAQFAFISSTAPRDIRVAYTEPGAPAAAAGLARGDRLLALDGIDAINGTDTAGLNAALVPRASGEQHSARLQRNDGSEYDVTLTAAAVTDAPVQNVKTIDSASGRIGYLQFNAHTEPAERQLLAAMNQFQSAGIADLVLDLRYNGGGLLAIASELAYMVATPAATQGKTFERLRFNSKNPFGYTAAQATLPFNDRTQGLSVSAGQPLPQLGLSRVTVLTGPDTCSASESIINSLRGVGVTVNLVGGSTCGKPYGFFPRDNCGTTYFAIQFQGVNDKGFGDYGDGFAPTCAVVDDFSHALGDPAEARLAAALALRANGSCPAASAKGDLSLEKTGALPEAPYLRRAPGQENRIVLPRDLHAAAGAGA